ACCPDGDVEAASGDHQRVTVVIAADQTGERCHLLPLGPAQGIVNHRLRQCLLDGLVAIAGFTCEPLDKIALSAASPELGKRHLGLLLAVQPEHDLRRAARSVVEQAFVDVADLFDIEGAEAEAATLADAARLLPLQELKGTEEMKHRAVVDGAGLRGRTAPFGTKRAALQERETVGVEKVAAVGRERGEIVRDAAMD